MFQNPKKPVASVYAALAKFLLVTILLTTLAVATPALAQVANPQWRAPAAPPSKETAQNQSAPQADWIRVLTNDKGNTVAMQTAIVRYVSKDQRGREQFVDLVGAVHVGDASYYTELNRRFNKYDAVLYELVAPDGTVVPRGGGQRSNHPVANIQTSMQQVLELEHQLAQVDYTKPHFIHADMSPADFADSMRDRNEGFMKMYFRLIGQSIGQQSRQAAKGKTMDFELLAAIFSNDRARKLKIVLATQLADSESLFSSFGGSQGSTLITERNKVALKKLRQQLAAGKKKVAVFYGAGHLADMDQCLQADFGMKPVSTTWLTAWDLEKARQ